MYLYCALKHYSFGVPASKRFFFLNVFYKDDEVLAFSYKTSSLFSGVNPAYWHCTPSAISFLLRRCFFFFFITSCFLPAWSTVPLPACLRRHGPLSLPLSMCFALIRREYRQTVLTARARQGCCRVGETTSTGTAGWSGRKSGGKGQRGEMSDHSSVSGRPPLKTM